MSNHAGHLLDVGCPTCNQESATAGYREKEAAVSDLVCPNCGHAFTTEAGQSIPVRVTESLATTDPAPAERWPLTTVDQVQTAWRETHRSREASRYQPTALAELHERIRAAAAQQAVTLPDEASVAEAINGQRSVNDTRQILENALEAHLRAAAETPWCYAWVQDFTADMVVYRTEGRTWQRSYVLAEEGTVGTVGFPDDPVEVVAQTWYVPAAGGDPSMPASDEATAESTAAPATETQRVRIPGRVLEAKEDDAGGGRVFRVRIIAAGESKNGRIYPMGVLAAAAPLYEGAKAYDHHRTPEEMATGTIRGMVGYYSDVASTGDGLEADLHLLPSAAHAAEALDAALAGDTEGREPLVGLSHDVQALFRQVNLNGARRMEATSIVAVNSADVVAHPAAGGKATRAVAGGIDPDGDAELDPITDPAGGPPAQNTNPKETDVTVSTEGVLAALKTATPEQLAAVGLTRSTSTETAPAPTPAPVVPARTVETHPKAGFMGGLLIRHKVADAGLPATVVESLTEVLPEQITEAAVDAQIASLKAALSIAERGQLVPSQAAVQVTQEALDKKKVALEKFFAGDFREGYHSFRQAFMDFTGRRPVAWDDDINRTILRESIARFDSGDRSTESLDSSSWAQVLGDSITRRMVAEYGLPTLQSWRRIVSAMPPINDFRSQRIGRIGGYGVLPTVGQGAPYQPLTSPPDEEATYAIDKKGGTEDLTFEMIANDDVRAISNIPARLGRAAAQTVYRFVFDMLAANIVCTYDGVALFHASHANTDSSAALSQTTLTAARVKMRDQAAYGDSSEIIGLTPRFIIVPNELEELAFQLTTSAVAIPATPAGPSDTPNLHQGLESIVVPYFTDPNDWFTIADPTMVPTVELGFYQGRQDPELFTQADPNVGSMFDADKLTYKIRHIYSGTWLDHRSAYRGVG